jgi:hypothetical protein
MARSSEGSTASNIAILRVRGHPKSVPASKSRPTRTLILFATLLPIIACSTEHHDPKIPPPPTPIVPVAAGPGAEELAAARTSRHTGAPPSASGGHPRIFLGGPIWDRALRRARERDPAHAALLAKCDSYLKGKVAWPDGKDNVDPPDIAEGYQGEGYFDPLMDLSLCYRLSRITDPERSVPYGEKGVEILHRMSEPDGPHAVDPLRDRGYGIRFYAVGMAIGYDWLNELIDPVEKKRLRESIHRWISAYESKGFGRDHPQGNYFAGYYAAKALSSLALLGDDPRSEQELASFESLHRDKVNPYYATHMRGGGWPEGWNYGAVATLNMTWPAVALKTARDVDLVGSGETPFRFPVEQAEHLIHFTWPSRKTMDDRGALYAGEEPAHPSPSVVTELAGLLPLWNAPIAPAFHRYAREVRDVSGKHGHAWEEMLYWDDQEKEVGLETLPLSYVTKGMQTVATRSSWGRDAVWATFTSGTYVGNPDSGEMYFDQGGLVVVRGGVPVLCNAHAALLRHSPSTRDGDGVHEAIYADLFGKGEDEKGPGNRTLHNVFYVKQGRFGQEAATPDRAKTRLSRFEDGGSYVLFRGEGLEDMYRKQGDGAVVRWTRQVTYVRPGRFVIDDRTTVRDPAADQLQSFHFAGKPDASRGSTFGLRSRLGMVGTVTSILPEGAKTSFVDVLEKGKVFRLEVRPGRPGPEQRWLTVVDTARSTDEAAVATVVRGEGIGAGVSLRAKEGSSVVVSADTPALRYTAPRAATLHLVTDLPPGDYSVTTSLEGANVSIRIVAGGPMKATEAGVLRFQIDRDGHLVKSP